MRLLGNRGGALGGRNDCMLETAVSSILFGVASSWAVCNAVWRSMTPIMWKSGSTDCGKAMGVVWWSLVGDWKLRCLYFYGQETM